MQDLAEIKALKGSKVSGIQTLQIQSISPLGGSSSKMYLCTNYEIRT